MCKHVAAVLYGVGARLDENPRLLFVLRDVDENELLASAGQDFPLTRAVPGAARVLDESDVAALFGLEMAETTDTPPPASSTPKRSRRSGEQSKAQEGSRMPARKAKPVAKKATLQKATRAGSGANKATRVSARKRRTRRPQNSV
jgi:uncharacterized Zn finger protein